MGKWLLSRRDRLIVPRHEVPGLEFGRFQLRVNPGLCSFGHFGPRTGTSKLRLVVLNGICDDHYALSVGIDDFLDR
jgi:hypothetical protein